MRQRSTRTRPAPIAIDESAIGKQVVDTVGREIGLVAELRQGTAYIDPDPGIVDRLRVRLGIGSAGPNAVPLHEDRITSVTDAAIRITDV